MNLGSAVIHLRLPLPTERQVLLHNPPKGDLLPHAEPPEIRRKPLDRITLRGANDVEVPRVPTLLVEYRRYLLHSASDHDLVPGGVQPPRPLRGSQPAPPPL